MVEVCLIVSQTCEKKNYIIKFFLLTLMVSALKFSKISFDTNARFISVSGQCIRDTFNVRPSYGIRVPTICGINTGQHSKNTYILIPNLMFLILVDFYKFLLTYQFSSLH